MSGLKIAAKSTRRPCSGGVHSEFRWNCRAQLKITFRCNSHKLVCTPNTKQFGSRRTGESSAASKKRKVHRRCFYFRYLRDAITFLGKQREHTICLCLAFGSHHLLFSVPNVVIACLMFGAPTTNCLRFPFSHQHFSFLVFLPPNATGQIENEGVRLRIVLEAEPEELHRLPLAGLEAEHGGPHALGGVSNTESGDVSAR